MARAVLPATSDSTVASANLTRILARLNARLAPPGALDQHHDALPSLERTKIAANLEYARQLLHRLESETAALKNPAARQRVYSELGEKKQLIRRLNESLQLLAQAGAEGGESDGDAEGEEMEPMLEPEESTERTQTRTGNAGADADADDDDDDADYASLAKQAQRRAAVTATATEHAQTEPAPAPTAAAAASQTVRHRFPHALQDSKERLFNERAAVSTSAKPDDGDKHAVLRAERQQQDELTDNMVSMAAQLKAAAVAFGQSLEDEKSYLDAAKEGLDRNARGMESAGQKMDNLRKNESVGFLWTWVYLAAIALLIFAILVVMLAMPKIRWW